MDVQPTWNEFVTGYSEGDVVLYVSIMNGKGSVEWVTQIMGWAMANMQWFTWVVFDNWWWVGCFQRKHVMGMGKES